MLSTYRLRLERKRWIVRAFHKRRELTAVVDRTRDIRPEDVLLFAVMRNERVRLPFFLDYYRDLGVGHFLIVDNGSDDGTGDYLAAHPDVSQWATGASYRRARFGLDWITWLQRRHGHGHWTLVVDTDEFLVYPFCDSRPLRALTDWLETCGIRSFGAVVVDLYPEGAIAAQEYREGQNPMEVTPWFDAGNYMIQPNARYRNLWIQGGPRARRFFHETPRRAPALNKVPLVKWQRGFTYISSTHMLLPRGLNQTHDTLGGEKMTGCLMHAKFLPMLPERSREEASRREHFADAREYRAYEEALSPTTGLWSDWSERYVGWRQLDLLGLMSRGNWV